MIGQVLAISVGAALGALSRWGLNLVFAPVTQKLWLGQLLGNWVGAFLIGMAMAWFSNNPLYSKGLELAIIVGFLGSLTTFSGFAYEMQTMLQAGRYAMLAGLIALHVLGSLLLVLAGLMVMKG